MTDPTREPSEAPITREEMVELFGDSMPFEAAALLSEAPPGWTLGQVRAELRKIATTKKNPAGPQPSEAEVEAAARAIQVEADKVGYGICHRYARAALTAAAQVRERTQPPCIFEARGPNGEPAAGFSGGRAWCRTHGFDCPELRTGPTTQPALMPIYGATEDKPAEQSGVHFTTRVYAPTELDSGPSVLGEPPAYSAPTKK